ncbi:MAG: hypothetical protein ACI4OI_00690 [Gemmiger sp.]
MLINILGYLLLPALGLALYRMGYEVGRQAACDDPDADPILTEHTRGGDGDA